MPVNARHFIRKMRGGAQAHLLEADDGHYYVVKFQNNPQHRRILVNEWIAGEILSHLQIAAPERRIVAVSREFLDRHPEVGFQLAGQHTAVEPGWHFGSRHPGMPQSTAIYDFIPDVLLSQVANAEQFLASLVFDRWVANADARQSIFFRAQLTDWLARPGIPPRKLGFVVLMIDHGFAFNGPHWDFPESAVAGLYHRRIVYQAVRSLKDFEPWLSRVVNFPEQVLDRALRQMPQEWIGEDETALMNMLERLMERRKRVPDLLHSGRNLAGLFPLWTG
jgi:hypothetical protein